MCSKMSFGLRLFLLAARKSSSPTVLKLSPASYRFASRDIKARIAQGIVTRASNRRTNRTYDAFEDKPGELDDDDDDDVEGHLEAFQKEEKIWQKTVKYHKMRRQMTPVGAPERKLTWDAIAQIRYLKHEHPQEWTVDRLAEGFSVTPDIICRVLRSKFKPDPMRKAKQDAKVMVHHGQPALSSGAEKGLGRPQLPGRSVPLRLASGSGVGAQVSLASHTLAHVEDGSKTLVPTASLTTTLTLPSEFSGKSDKYTEHMSGRTKTTEEYSVAEDNEFEGEEEEEGWDGLVFSEEELEELMQSAKTPARVWQKEMEFFDSDGNFLYRI